ncbi:hypothetical protein NP493_85g07000 [Ridgeia piscesae]|uniref:Uncharacterized protein n=1 Tax=Ridgeia piscesae TaxID=27915 RepID=A0AAD9P8S6_RIDPI|nr:hypothetical protein NP493_85g07000 [Ridgeia piscesae]
MMINQDKRFKESYADTPGPGTYEFSPLIQDTVLKPTFNATLNNPISARVDYPPGASGAQPFLLGV